MKKILNKIMKNKKNAVALILGLLISATAVYAATTITASNVTYTNNGQSTAQGALNDLYNKVASCPSGKACLNKAPVKLGDYISLTPTKTSFSIKASLTGYTSNQTINPSELKLWRVIDFHSDGSFDAVSEYTSSTAVYFSGATGYANFVGTLNTIAAQYQVPGYTIGSRHMGYGGQTSIIGDTSAFDGTTTSAPSTTSTSSPYSGNGSETSGGVLGDTLYLKDYILVGNVYKSDTSTYGSKGVTAYDVSATTTKRAYWIPSRRYDYEKSTSFRFNGRVINTNDTLGVNTIRNYYNGNWNNANYACCYVRPILTLKSELTIKSGSGTKASPYVFN